MNLQKGLIGHWSMDDVDISGGTVYDRSAYNNHGNINNNPNTVDGIVGDALEFTDGNSEWIDGSSALDYKGALSVVVWIKPNMTTVDASDSPSRRGLIDDDVFDIVQKVNENISMRLNSTAIGDVNDNTFEYKDGEWSLATMTFDGSTLKMYRNTEQLDSASASISTPSSAPRIATKHDDNQRMWQGQIAEVRVYDRALSESEISALYNIRSQRQQNVNTAHRDNIVLYLDARNENSFQQGDTVWRDISGNGHDAFGDPNAQGSGTDSTQFPEWQTQNGGRFYFDGSKGLTITDTMSTSGQLTIETWMKRSTSGEVNYLSDARNGTGNWHLTNYENHNISFGYNLHADDPDTYQINSNWWGDWHHFVMTSDGSNSKLYVDGQQITDSRLKSSSGFNTGLGQYFRIGNRYTSGGRLVGHISTYRLYDDVLSTGQVQANYNAEKIYHK